MVVLDRSGEEARLEAAEGGREELVIIFAIEEFEADVGFEVDCSAGWFVRGEESTTSRRVREEA